MSETTKMMKATTNADEDRISNLPDCILASARTSILSPRWRYLWTFSSLNLGNYSLYYPHSIAFIDNLLSSHHGSFRSIGLSFSPETVTPVNRWVQTLAHSGLQSLRLSFSRDRDMYTLPACLLSSETLEVLSLYHCRFPAPSFVTLKDLTLRCVPVTDDLVSDLMSECRNLESLDLLLCEGLDHVVIRSPSVRKLAVNFHEDKKMLIVEDAPNLEILMLGESTTQFNVVKVVHTSKLKLLGFVNLDINTLQLGDSMFHYSSHTCWDTGVPNMTRTSEKMIVNLGTLVLSLKTLAISLKFNNARSAQLISELLKCFPCLETLDVVNAGKNSEFYGGKKYWEEEELVDCVENHLKAVRIMDFAGESSDLGFAKYILETATVLETMILICRKRIWKKVDALRRKLFLKNRASYNARVVFLHEYDHGSEFSTWESLRNPF